MNALGCSALAPACLAAILVVSLTRKNAYRPAHAPIGGGRVGVAYRPPLTIFTGKRQSYTVGFSFELVPIASHPVKAAMPSPYLEGEGCA